MAGFKKARAEQAALKMAIYGPPGSGKTFTTLLIAEGLAGVTGKRVAMIDTEHGSDFYCQAVPSRNVHPAAFDFDALYTKSITETLSAVRGLNPNEYSVVIIDSITHMWESARAAFDGKPTKGGGIPMHAWGRIKKPYKDLMQALLSSPMHVFICGRQGIEYETDDETDELKAVGYKMKAEGETPYEPHILIRMEAQKAKRTNEVATIVAYAEKDRTGVLAGRSFVNPTFDSLCRPLLSLLGDTQAKMATDDETATKDAEAIAADDAAREAKSTELLRQFSARIELTNTAAELKTIGAEITPKLKSQMVPADVGMLRERYQERDSALSRTPSTPTAEEMASQA